MRVYALLLRIFAQISLVLFWRAYCSAPTGFVFLVGPIGFVADIVGSSKMMEWNSIMEGLK